MVQHPVFDLRHFRMPAEWAPHAGTILTWPHRPAIWKGVHADVERTFARIAAELSEFEQVHINVPDEATWQHAETLIRRAGGDLHEIVWHTIDSDDVWARDHGPIFVTARPDAPAGTPPIAMLDWVFNAWGGKFAAELDNLIPGQMNAHFDVPRVQPGLVMEGGSLEVNGRGDLLTTEAVLLNTNRNPGLSREELEASLRLHLGVERLHWLGSGLAGDDTDGHVDDLARFVSEDAIVAVRPTAGHPDEAVLTDNLKRIRAMRGAEGRGFRIETLPSPEPITYNGEHLPASYANFYIANGKVLVPTFDQRTDAEAISILRNLFPGRLIIGIDGRALVTQSGNIHCVTQQVPA
jgi:agmatine deiminase